MSSAVNIPVGLCHCGCGGKTSVVRWNIPRYSLKKGDHRKFLVGHTSRGPQFGRIVGKNGYVFVQAPGHPRCRKYKNYVLEHILVAERALGRFLVGQEEVHHVDEIKSHNENSNLVICQDRAYHMLLHQRMRSRSACGNPSFRPCTTCLRHDNPADMVARISKGVTLYQHHSGSKHYEACLEYRRARDAAGRKAKGIPVIGPYKRRNR